MKNPKILYILIGVLCVLSIIAGIYAQFFVKDEDKNNVIMPPFNQTDGNEVKEKSSEEIKAQFNSLFNNVLNSGEYDTSGLPRIVEDKDIVYSAYDISKTEENYEVNIHLPIINIRKDVPISFNQITQSVFADKASEILGNKINSKVIYHINYTAYINGDILSLIIEGTLKEGDKPQRVIVQTYNYNLTTGQKVELGEMLAYKNIIQSDVQKKITKTVEKAKKEAEILVQSGYTVYNRDLNSDMYKLANVPNYFLGPNGNLYIVFAYGNQNFTSEMDIVFYE